MAEGCVDRELSQSAMGVRGVLEGLAVPAAAIGARAEQRAAAEAEGGIRHGRACQSPNPTPSL